MTPEQIQQMNTIEQKLDQIIDVYYRTHFIDRDVFRNPVYLPIKTAFFGSSTPVGQQTAITPPSGGATIDSQSRTAINSIITVLQTFKFTQ